MKPRATRSLPAGYVSFAAVAAHYQVCVMTVKRWVARGLIPSRKIGRSRRFDLEEVDEAVRRFFSAKVRTR